MLYILLLLFTLTYATKDYIPCRDKAAQFQGPGRLIGSFIPRCREENDLLYQTLQCHGSIGMCVCVDQVTGNPFTPFWRLTEKEFSNMENICDEKKDLNNQSI